MADLLERYIDVYSRLSQIAPYCSRGYRIYLTSFSSSIIAVVAESNHDWLSIYHNNNMYTLQHNAILYHADGSKIETIWSSEQMTTLTYHPTITRIILMFESIYDSLCRWQIVCKFDGKKIYEVCRAYIDEYTLQQSM